MIPEVQVFGEDSAENRLKRTLFLVEATSFEQSALWEKHAHDSTGRKNNSPVKKWEQIGMGWGVKVGELANMPCMMSTSWARIDGHLVLFWYQCSTVTDSRQAESWLDKHFKGTYDKGTRRARTDASNFHHCLQAIREANAEPKPPVDLNTECPHCGSHKVLGLVPSMWVNINPDGTSVRPVAEQIEFLNEIEVCNDRMCSDCKKRRQNEEE